MSRDARQSPEVGTFIKAAVVLALLGAALAGGSAALAQPLPPDPIVPAAPLEGPAGPPAASPSAGLTLPDLTRRENFSAAMQLILLLTVLSLAPAILVLMTSFTRIVIVLSLLRQALGTQSLPPNQVLIGMSLFMTFLIMAPTWARVNETALQPYMQGRIDQREALSAAQKPLRDFMRNQIDKTGNYEDVVLFTDYAKKPRPQTWDEVDTLSLIPGFVLSELKTAFLLGFKIYLPFLVIDLIVSVVLISMGMMMLPPVLISLPFKLLLFVLVDGWRLITGSLMGSFMT